MPFFQLCTSRVANEIDSELLVGQGFASRDRRKRSDNIPKTRQAHLVDILQGPCLDVIG